MLITLAAGLVRKIVAVMAIAHTAITIHPFQMPTGLSSEDCLLSEEAIISSTEKFIVVPNVVIYNAELNIKIERSQYLATTP